jgi:hypothetical protein
VTWTRKAHILEKATPWTPPSAAAAQIINEVENITVEAGVKSAVTAGTDRRQFDTISNLNNQIAVPMRMEFLNNHTLRKRLVHFHNFLLGPHQLIP